MTDSIVQTCIFEFLSAQMSDGASATHETRILEDTSMDSVKVMDFLLELEDELDITISLNRLSNVETAGDLIQQVEAIYSAAQK